MGRSRKDDAMGKRGSQTTSEGFETGGSVWQTLRPAESCSGSVPGEGVRMPGFVCRWAFLEFPALLHPEPSGTGDLIPEPPFSSGTPTPTCWGCSSAGMAFTRRWALPSSAAAPSLNLASTRCASSHVPGGRKYRTRLHPSVCPLAVEPAVPS